MGVLSVAPGLLLPCGTQVSTTMNAMPGSRAMTELDPISTAQLDTIESVLELPLLLSRQQIDMLAVVAERQGLTSAQLLRRYISSICENESQGS